jgi:hypothetical protein
MEHHFVPTSSPLLALSFREHKPVSSLGTITLF